MLYTLYLLIITCFTAVKNDLRRMQMCTCCRAGRAMQQVSVYYSVAEKQLA